MAVGPGTHRVGSAQDLTSIMRDDVIDPEGIDRSFWKYWVPPVSIGVLILLACYKFVFLGMIPINSDWLVNTFEPWKSALGNERVPYEYNHDFDPVIYVYPMKYLTVRLMKEGVLPLWNPYILAGTPLWGNNYQAPLNPLNVVFFFLPFGIAWGLFLILQLAIAGFSTYGYMRELGIGRWASSISGSAYSLNGTFIVWLENTSFVGVYAWVPLFLWLCERAVKRKSLPMAVILGYVLAVYFLSGLIQVAVYSFLFSAMYLVMRLIQAVIDKQIALDAAITIVGVAVAISATVASAEIFLTAQAVRNASRPVTQYAQWAFIHPPMLLSLVSPYFFGLEANGTEVGNSIFYRGSLRLNPPYVGVVTLILAVIGWGRLKGWLRYFYGLFTGGLLMIFLLLAVQRVHEVGRRLVPLFDSVDHYRIMGLYALSVCVLAGFGFHALVNGSVDSRARARLVVGIGFFAVVVLAAIQALALADPQAVVAAVKALASPFIGQSHRLRGMVRFIEYLSTLNQKYGSVLLSKQVLIPAGMLTAGLVIVSMWVSSVKGGRVSKFLQCSTVAIVAADLLAHASIYQPYSRTLYPETGVIRFLKGQSGIFRILGISDRERLPEEPGGDMLPPSTNLLYGLYDIRGYETLHPRWYYRLMTGNDEGRIIDKLNDVPRSWLNFLNVRFILTSRRLENSEYKLVYDREVKIYENRSYGQRARFVSAAEFYGSDDETLRRVQEADFDPDTVVVLGKDGQVGATAVDRNDSRTLRAANGTAAIVRYDADALEVVVETDRPGWLVLSESHSPGWVAWVNDVRRPVLRANYAFRAVSVDSGSSRVILRYRPNFGYFLVLMVAVIPASVWLVLRAREKRTRERRLGSRRKSVALRPEDQISQ